MTAKQTFFSTDLEKALDNTLTMIKTFVGKVEEKCSTAVKKTYVLNTVYIFPYPPLLHIISHNSFRVIKHDYI